MGNPAYSFFITIYVALMQKICCITVANKYNEIEERSFEIFVKNIFKNFDFFRLPYVREKGHAKD